MIRNLAIDEFRVKAANEDKKNMSALADRRFPIQANGSADTKNLRELLGERHQQDAEHDQHLQEHGNANAQRAAAYLLSSIELAPN